MANSNATTFKYTQADILLGVESKISGDIVLPGGGNNDVIILGFNDANDNASGVNAIVKAHNLIEDSAAEIASAAAEHSVNTNNFYIGVDGNNMNAGQQLVFDFATVGSDGQGNTSNANEVSSMDIKLFNFGSEKSGDELFITVITKDPNNAGNTIKEATILTQDADYTSDLEYTVRSTSGNPIVGIEFLAGNNSSFKLGVKGIGAIKTDDTFKMEFGYDITDADGDKDNGIVTVNVDSDQDGVADLNTSLSSQKDSSVYHDSADHILDAGAGTDTLLFKSGNGIDFNSFAKEIKNIEAMDLKTDTNANSLSNITRSEIIDMTDSRNDLTIFGSANDNVSFKSADGWVKGGTTTDNGNTFDIYTNSNDSSIRVLVEDNINDVI